MDLSVQPSTLSGELAPQPSKLHTQLATALALLADGKSTIEHPLRVKDTMAVLQAIEKFGATTKKTQERWSIWGVGKDLKPTVNVINAKNSATALAILTSIASLAPQTLVLNGDAQLRLRPMPGFLKSLRHLGISAHSTKPDESPPFVTFGGGVNGGEIGLGASESRYLPAIVLPAPYAEKQVKIQFRGARQPQVELTIELLNAAGVKIQKRTKKLCIPLRPYHAFNVRTPPDLTAAAPFIAAAVLTDSKLKIREFKRASGRDVVFLRVMKQMGVGLRPSKKGFAIEGAQTPKAARVDLSLAPELLPIVAVLACRAKGKTTISNASEARWMKSDRITAIARGLRRMHARVVERRDGLLIKGTAKLKGCVLDGHGDHAVVAALVAAGLSAEGETRIKGGADAVQTSYSRFTSTFQGLGAKVNYIP